jgi:glycosyltransferase involved in cell wall biosynthesis
MKRVTFAVPGDLATPTGGYAYDRRVIAELRALGWQVDALDIGDSFPRPNDIARAAARRKLLTTPARVPLVVDGLALGVIPEIAAELARTRPVIALVHHPLALETGVSEAETQELRASERKALAHTKRIVVTSATTAEILVADYGARKTNVTVAMPGHDTAQQAAGSSDGVSQLLAVGSIVPRKGYDVLIAALAQIIGLQWHLTIAGDRTRDPAAAAALDGAIADARLGGRITLKGILTETELTAAYLGADIFVQASRFEGYGMAAASAIAHGLPIIATDGGALGNTVGNAGLVVPAEDVSSLADALRKMISDPAERQRHRTASQAAARNLQSWQTTATQFSAAIEAAT